jgi:hypothetical protein
MAATKILDFNAEVMAWEPREHRKADATVIGWHVAAVRDGSVEDRALFQAAEAGIVYEAETGEDDAGAEIAVLAESKRHDLGAVCMLHSLYVRAEATTDSVRLIVRAGGSEYGEVERAYTVSLTGAEDREGRIRIHRTIIGRWAQVIWEGNVAAGPAIREMVLSYVPMRMGRVSQ